MQTHRQIAKRKTVIWQVTAVVILAAAGAAIALPAVSDFFAPDKPDPPKPPVVIAKPTPPDYSKLPFIDAMKGASASAHQVVAIAVKPPDPPDPELGGGSAPPPPPPSSTDWAYIGSIITPANRHALVKVEGQQQIYSIGSTHNDAKLVIIEPDHIEVEVGGVRKSIQLTERTLLAPAEGPKRPVAFRNGPNLAQPGGPGSPMVMNAINRPNPGASNASTLEQARAASMAAAEAARRAQMPSDVPGMVPFEKLDGDEVQQYAKSLNDPSLDEGARSKYLSLLGIVPGTPVDQALARAKEAGVDLGSEAGKHIINSIEGNAKNRGNR